MPDQHYTIQDAQGNQVRVQLRRDKRLAKTIRWERLPDTAILVRVPHRFPRHKIEGLLDQIAAKLDKSIPSHSRRTDADLHRRAERINRTYFQGNIQWNAIRWVGNMQSRLGSCTKGGPTDGQIRISDKIRSWPEWVIDYVIAHELMHRKHPNHSDAFWSDLQAAYPLSERARGFIEGIGFGAGHPMEDD